MRFLFVFLLILPAIVNADPAICSNLHAASCAPGSYNDGTATVVTPALGADADADPLFVAAMETMRPQVRDAIRNPANLSFRQATLSATGLAVANEECAAAGRSGGVLTDQCLNLMTESLMQYLPRAHVAGLGRRRDSPTIESLDFLFSNPEFERLAAASRDEIARRIDLPEQERRVRTIFPRVKEMMIAHVRANIRNPAQRDLMIEKLTAIRFTTTDCMERNRASAPVGSLLVQNAFYTPNSNTFSYCAYSLSTNPSIFSLVQTVAHEMGHAIDPCNISRGPPEYSFQYTQNSPLSARENEYPYAGLIQCLRQPISVNASRAPGGGGIGLPGGMMMGAAGSGGGGIVEISNRHTSESFCEGDQIGDTFADWIAAEILPQYISTHHSNLTDQQRRIGYSNVWRTYCQWNLRPQEAQSDWNDHPSYQNRTNAILLVQPQIRQQMGCSAEISNGRNYCPANTPVGALRPNPLDAVPPEEADR